VNLSSLFFN